MTRLSHFALVASTVVLLLAGEGARADLVNFSYHWTIEPGSVISGGAGLASFALAPDGDVSAETGKLTAIPGAYVTTASSATSPPDVFNAIFSLNLQLTDTASGDSDTLKFAGTLTGTLTADSSELFSTFSEPVTQSLDLGGYHYQVTIDPVFSNLPFPGSEAPVLLDALVTATPRTADTPEPSSLALGATAVALVALARRRRKA